MRRDEEFVGQGGNLYVVQSQLVPTFDVDREAMSMLCCASNCLIAEYLSLVEMVVSYFEHINEFVVARGSSVPCDDT